MRPLRRLLTAFVLYLTGLAIEASGEISKEPYPNLTAGHPRAQSNVSGAPTSPEPNAALVDVIDDDYRTSEERLWERFDQLTEILEVYIHGLKIKHGKK